MKCVTNSMLLLFALLPFGVISSSVAATSSASSNQGLTQALDESLYAKARVLGEQPEANPGFKLPEITKIQLPSSFNLTNSSVNKIPQLIDASSTVGAFLDSIKCERKDGALSFIIPKENLKDEDLKKDVYVYLTPTSLDKPIYFFVESRRGFENQTPSLLVRRRILKLTLVKDPGELESYTGNISYVGSIVQWMSGEDVSLVENPIKALSTFLFLVKNDLNKYRYVDFSNEIRYKDVFDGVLIIREALKVDFGKTIQMIRETLKEGSTRSKIVNSADARSYMPIQLVLSLFAPDLVNSYENLFIGEDLVSNYKFYKDNSARKNKGNTLSEYVINSILNIEQYSEFMDVVREVLKAALKNDDPWLRRFIEGMKASSDYNRDLINKMLDFKS